MDKHETTGNNQLYHGTTINSGKCIAQVTATGNGTELGRLGKAVATYNPPKTILQLQLNPFVRRFGLFGLIGFLIILSVNYIHSREWITSLLDFVLCFFVALVSVMWFELCKLLAYRRQ